MTDASDKLPDCYEELDQWLRSVLDATNSGVDAVTLQPAADDYIAAIRRVVSDLSADGTDAKDRFQVLTDHVTQVPALLGAAHAADQELLAATCLSEGLSLITTAATCRMSRNDFHPRHLEGSEDLVRTIADVIVRVPIENEAPDLYSDIGAAIDLWSQATGIAVPNPTGRWVVQMDALRRGWRRPRVGRAVWTTCDLPATDDYMHAILKRIPDNEKITCLAALVERGMNRELALEVAGRLGPSGEDELVDALAASREEGPDREYPPMVQQALRLSKSVMKLTQNLVTGEKIIVSEEERLKRLSACSDCHAYVAEEKRCLECGCFLKAKLRIATEHCPIGKW